MIIFLFVISLVKSQDNSNLIFGNENGNFDFQKCGESVSCLTMEGDCEPGTSNCGLVQWKTLDTSEIEITLHFWSEEDSWVGVGFSRDTNMGQDDIYYCQKRSGRISVLSAYSIGMTRPIEVQNDGEVIADSVETWTSGNQYSCTFRRTMSVTKNDIEYDLSDENWFILLSTGSVTSAETQYHGPSTAGRAISSNQRVVFSPSQPHIFLGQESSSTTALKAHAIIMVFAWALLAPLGLLIARLVRRGKLEDLKIGSNQSWFVLHRGLMVTTVMITIVSLIIVMVNRGGWSNSAGNHAILGIITIILAFLNPIGALFRPDKFSVNRVFFNVIHSSNGYLTLIFSIATIFLGMDLALLDLDLWVTQLFSFQVIFIGLIGITSELFKSKLEGPKNIILLVFFTIVISILSFIIIGNISKYSFPS